MKLTRERKIYLIAGGAALLALGVDQVLFAGPGEEAPAPETALVPRESAAAAMSSPQVAAFIAPFEAREDAAVAERLRRVASAASVDPDGSTRDAFAVPESWMATKETPQGSEVATRRDKGFEASHQLDAVLPNAPMPCGMVDGTPVLVGQQVDGHTLEAVRERSVVFVKGDARFELHLDNALTATTEVE